MSKKSNEVNQDKISFALEQLEKARDDVKNISIDHSGYDEFDFQETTRDDCVAIIDNQIKQLKDKMMSKLQSSFRTVKENDDVYWNEVDYYDENHNPVYATHNGYYLASYHMGEELYHIVSFHQITSCVVRHIKAQDLFLYYEDAKKECDIKK